MPVNGPGAVILSHGLWQRRTPDARMSSAARSWSNDRAATIVGVMPPTFDFGAVFAPGVQIDVYMPAVFDVLRDWGNTMAVLARRRPDMTPTPRIGHQRLPSRGVRALQRRGPDPLQLRRQPFHESIVAPCGVRC